MTKVKEKVKEDVFGGFNLIKGGIVPDPTVSKTDTDEVEDDVIGKDPTILDDEVDEVTKENIKKADDILFNKGKEKPKDTKDIEDTDEEEVEDTEDKPEDLGYKSTILALYDKGILHVDPEKIEDNEDSFTSAVSNTVQKMFKDEVEKLNPEYREFLGFVQNGGDPKQFLDVYYGTHSWEDYKIESEETQKAAIRESLRLEGHTPEDIEEIVTEWADNGNLEKRAKTHLTKLQKIEATQKKELVERQKEYAEQQKEAEKQYWDSFKKSIFDKDEIKGFKLTPKVKENLWEFYTKVDRQTGKTPYQLAVENDQEAALLFGLQAMNKFDISKLEKQVETRVSHKYNSMFKNYSKTSKERISAGVSPDPSGENPFEGFKKS